jgi:hypothetical protein
MTATAKDATFKPKVRELDLLSKFKDILRKNLSNASKLCLYPSFNSD